MILLLDKIKTQYPSFEKYYYEFIKIFSNNVSNNVSNKKYSQKNLDSLLANVMLNNTQNYNTNEAIKMITNFYKDKNINIAVKMKVLESLKPAKSIN
jgi:hypothetical protein